MNEQDFTKNISRILNQGLSSIESDKLARLRNSRMQALDAYPNPIRVLGLVTVDGATFSRTLSTLPKYAIGLTTALLITYIALTSSSNPTYDELSSDPFGEVDAALIGQELPVHAFLDQDLDNWIKESM